MKDDANNSTPPLIEYFGPRRNPSKRYFDKYHRWAQRRDLSLIFRGIAIAVVLLAALGGCLLSLFSLPVA